MPGRKQSESEEILNRIRKLREKTRVSDKQNKSDNKTGKSPANKYPLIKSIVNSVKTTLSPLGKPVAWILSHLKSIIGWAALANDGQGNNYFSLKQFVSRGLLVLLGFLVLHVALSAVYFYGTQYQEVVYTTGKQEIVNGEEYQFTGCTSLPCSTSIDNGKYYKITSSLYFPYLIYPEENVYANIPLQDGACHVKGYGIYFRRARFFVKQFQWWQQVYSVQCRPYTEAEKDRAINSGKINTILEN